jgi:polysaccharide biosynthesis/export protein
MARPLLSVLLTFRLVIVKEVLVSGLPKICFSLSLSIVLSWGSVSMLRAQNSQPSNAKKQNRYVAANAKDGGTEEPAANPKAPILNSTIQPPAGYRVGTDDELMISVWHEPELSQDVVVRPDGMITLPLLNDIKIQGLTTSEVQTLLTEKMKPLVNEPQVTVIVKAIKSRKVFLVGNIARQGSYELTGTESVLQVIAEAGGLGPFAKAGSIYVLRNENGKQLRLPVNYKRALSGKGATPELLPGDMVVVP